MRLSALDIVFFIVLGLILFVALWLLNGSPTLESSLISISIFVFTSEFMLWRKVFAMDKNTAVSFTRLKNDVENIKVKLNDIDKLSIKMDNIEKLILKKHF